MWERVEACLHASPEHQQLGEWKRGNSSARESVADGPYQAVEGAFQDERSGLELVVCNALEDRGRSHGHTVQDNRARPRQVPRVVEGLRDIQGFVEADAGLVPSGAARTVEVDQEGIEAPLVKSLRLS